MSRRLKLLPILAGDQALAADPSAHAALSASAGTGKTQVLTARVLRLLLQGVDPAAILCLTFTKSGAAEMSNRISERLAYWVRLPSAALATELKAIGEDVGPAALQRARRLFARVLEAPGGLRIQTIHAFAQTLLSSFPAEAGITPGFQPIEGRAEQELARRTLSELLTIAEREGNAGLMDDVATLSMRVGEEEAVGYLMRCARAGDAIAAVGGAAEIEPALRAAVGLPDGDIEQHLVDHCQDGAFDRLLFQRLIAANRAWGTATGGKIVDRLTSWLALDAGGRAQGLEGLNAGIITKDGAPCRVAAKQLAAEPDYADLAIRFGEWHAGLVALRSAAALVAVQAAGLRAGVAFAAAYTAAKRTAGVADFDDLIAWTRELFSKPGMSDWVRYKLDRRTDHVLIDEAQDTNASQWAIVDALAGEFFSGVSEAEARWRTLFMVGDFKQAIFGFQGTDPLEYNKMRETVRERAHLLIEAEDGSDRGGPRLAREFRDLSIDASFRSAPAVLEVVDALIREVGHIEMGLPDRPNPHRSMHQRWAGRVEHWPAFEPEEAQEDEGEEDWITETDRLHATRLAEEVRKLITEAPILASTRRPLCPADVLILVRSRKELASLIVARLFAAGVPVAGIDRLHLQKPLAVRDLVSAMAFVAQPLDDLNLASLLVSPLLGWDQEQLYTLAQPRPEKQPLWRALNEAAAQDPFAEDTVGALGELLRIADYVTPARFLETILSGQLDGRRKLLRRLGESARDPIDELLASALDFERTDIPSIDRFLAQFLGGEIEIKRDASAASNAVRVMTVHGSKGLEAPVVILADATADPAKVGGSRSFELRLKGGRVPLIRPRKNEMISPFSEIAADDKVRDLQEHWRLLYVALTRAKERLIVAGVMPSKLSDNSWHVKVEQALGGLGAVRDESSGRLVWTGSVLPRSVVASAGKRILPPPPIPAWLRAPAPAEPRPPRPLAPSSRDQDREGAAPPSPAQVAAARRGTLLHTLFERLPGVPQRERRRAALAWLQRSAKVPDEAVRAEIADAALRVLDDPQLAGLFSPDSLGEAPIAATLPDGRVVAGTVDRLCIGADLVRVIDFKTGRQAPDSLAQVPTAHLKQMTAYTEALSAIFPGRRVEAALLYTAVPRLIVVSG